MKALFRHKASGDLFAIEFDEDGEVLSTPANRMQGQA